MQQQVLPPFSGTGVALITPFSTTGTIDFPALGRVIDHVIAGGVDYIVSLGTTGEATTLSLAECRQVLSYTIEQVEGRVPVVAGFFGGNNTQMLVERIKTYDFTGVAAIMSSGPSYNKPSEEGIYQHYLRLADASSLPIIIYNVPGRTSSNIRPTTILRLAEYSEVFCAVKEASGNLMQAMQIIKHRPAHFGVLSGEDPLTLAMIAAGGNGGISVIANLFPQHFSEMISSALQGNIKLAQMRNLQLLDVHKWLYLEGNPTGLKAGMSWAGLCENKLRLPLVPLSKANELRLLEELEKVPSLVGV